MKAWSVFGALFFALILTAAPVNPTWNRGLGWEVSKAEAITYRRARVTSRRAYRRGYYGGYGGYGGYYGGYGGSGGYPAYSYPSYGYGGYVGYPAYSYPSYGYGYRGYRPYFGARPGLF